MQTFFGSLREKDRHRDVAVVAATCGPGPPASISGLLGIDSSTIRQGQADLKHLPDVPPDRCRNKGAGENHRQK